MTDGPKPTLVRELGATYHRGAASDACAGADVVVECTGVAELVFQVLNCTAPAGIVCLTGVSTGGRLLRVDAGALNRELVLENDVVFGSVNASAAHYHGVVDALAGAEPGWLARLITRPMCLGEWQSALEQKADDVKVVIDLDR
ncbi:MAG: hypothetical protein M3P85_16845 [Actinomycetota bacterium]|nr:hypothetical protein [Actinomycetota bacterium]